MKFNVGKMSRRRSRSVRKPRNTTTCCFCGSSEDDEVEYGKLCTHNGIVTHYYCLLLSSNMEQNGNDNEGILGFLPTDIHKELRRGKRLACTHCKQTGATLGCCNARCKRVFHLPCGLRAGSLHQFFGEFRSYCITHRLKQEIDEHIKAEAAAAGTVTCYICYEEVNPQNTIRTLWAPCCRKNAWFHRKCVQRLALSAGYFFKCPLCNNKQEFQQAMLDHGIFIPNQDASWELVPNAYQELLHRHSSCDAVECICPKGRSHTGLNSKWELVLCRLCGSQGVHKACGHIKWASSMWECAECVGMLRRTDEANPCTNQSKEKLNDAISVDESSSDSDISVGRNPSPLPITQRPDSPLPIPSLIKLRPGPRSFKLQQAVQIAKRKNLQEKTCTSNTLVPLSSRSDTVKSSLPNETINCDEELQVIISTAENILLSTESTSIETNSTISRPVVSNDLLKAALNTPVESKRREAEVIMIDSDDEVEIISVKPKQNVLTTNDGRQIQIHSLCQASAETQKAEGHVKPANSRQSEIPKSLPRQSKSIPVTNNPIVSDTANLSNTGRPASAPTVAPLLHSSHLSRTPFTIRDGIDICVEKAFGNDIGLDRFLITEIPKRDSVMNLKITNVTSVREEDFAATFQEVNNVCPGGSKNDLPPNVNRRAPIIQPTASIKSPPKSRATAFQLSTSAIADNKAKRKSEEYAEKSSCNLLNNEKVMENRKKARTCESNNSGPIVKSTNMPWNINYNDVNRAIPLLSTSFSNCSSNSNKFEQSTATLQSQATQLQTDIDGQVKIIFNQDIQKINHIYKYPPGTKLPGIVRQTTNNITYHLNLSNNVSSQNGSPNYSTNFPKVRKTYSSVQAQKTNRLSLKNLEPNSINVQDTTASNQQLTVNGSQNSPEISSKSSQPETLAKQTPKSSESVIVTSSSVHQPHENVNREMPRYKKKKQSYPRLSTADLLFYNGLPRNCTEIPTSSNGNQPNVNNTSKTNQSITQLANGIPIPSGCDGDAGSSPVAEAGSTHQATSRSPVHPQRSIIFTNSDATSDARQSTDVNSSVSTCDSVSPTRIQHHHSSPTTTRKYCDKHRLIPEKVPIRNLKFRVVDSNSIQIFISDTSVLNICADIGNLRNNRDASGPRSPIRKKEMLHILTEESNSSSSKSGITGNYDKMSIITSYKGHDLPEIRRCSKTDYTLREFTRSVTKNLYNQTVRESKFDGIDTSATPATITDGKNKTSCLVEAKSNIVDKIPDSYTNQALLSGNNKTSFCVHHKENLSKEKKVCTAFSNNGSHLKNLCERDDNIMYVDKRKRLSDEIKQSSVKIFKFKNNIRNASNIDFDKTHDCLNDKDEKKRSFGPNRVTKYLVKSLDGLSKSNLSSIDCHNNLKQIVDRSSEFNSSIKDLDANTENSLNNDADLVVENGVNIISTDFDAEKSKQCFDTRNSNESEVQADYTNFSPDNSNAVLSNKNINSDISLRKQMDIAFKNKTSSHIADEESITYESGISIKVKIDLNKIQQLIDSKPQLFDKRSYEGGSKTSPILETAKNSHNPASNNSLHFYKTRTASQSVQDTDNSPAKKRLRYDSAFIEDHPNS